MGSQLLRIRFQITIHKYKEGSRLCSKIQLTRYLVWVATGANHLCRAHSALLRQLIARLTSQETDMELTAESTTRSEVWHQPIPNQLQLKLQFRPSDQLRLL